MTRSVKVIIGAEIADLKAKLREGGAAVRGFAGELDRAAKGKHLDTIIAGATGAGVAMVGLAGVAVKFAMDFDKAMSAAAAATKANAVEFDQLRQAALKAGKDTSFSATQAAQGITELGKAGVSTKAILNGGLKGALDLAAAGQISVGEAAEVAASAMTQFKLSGAAIPHVADLLAAGAGKAQGSVHDMGQALNQAGLVAGQFGLNVEDTTGVLAEFASAGLIGSDAGTSLKQMLLMLANPTDQTKDKMAELNLKFYDAKGQFVGLAGVAQELQSKLRGLTQEQRNAALGQIFGSDAIRAASILYTDGATGVQKWRDAVNESGFASETAAKLTDNLAGDLERLKGSLETVAIQAGGGVTNGLRTLTQAADGAVDAFSELPSWVQSSITVLSGVGGAGLLAAAGFLKARGVAADLMSELRDMGPRGTAAATGLGKVAGIAGKLGIAGAAAVGLYEGFKLFGDWIDSFSAPVSRDVDKMGQSLRDFSQSGRVAGELAKTFGANLSGLQRDLQTVTEGQARLSQISTFPQSVYAGRGAGAAPNAAEKAKLEQEVEQAKTNIAALDQTLANMVNSGNATAAKLAFDQFAAATGLGLDRLPAYQQAAAGAAQANAGLAQGFGTASSNATTMAGSLNAAVQAGQKLTDVWNQLNGAVLSSDQANLAAKQSISAVKAAFKENGNAIEGNSQKALKNRIAVGEAAKAAADAAQKKYEETGSVAAASDVYNGYIGQLRKTLGQSKLTKGEVNRLLSTYAQMPAAATTKVSAPGAKGATGQVNALQSAINSIPSRKTVEIAMRVTGNTNASAVAAGLRKQYNAKGSAMIPMASGGGIYPASNPPLVQFAEPETGGELYLPKRGISRSRARGLLAQGAAWHGLGITPMAAGGLVNVAPSTSTPTGPTLTGSRLDYLESLIAARNAVAALTASLKENGKAWSTASAKGRENRSALISGVRAAQQAAQAKYQETGSVSAANKVYNDYIKALDKSLKAMGVNAKQRKALIATYSEKPKYDLPDAAVKAPTNSSGRVRSITDQVAAEQALSSTKKAFAWTKPSFNTKTETGQAELTQLFSFLGAAEQAAQSLYAEGGNAKASTALYNSYIAQLRTVLSKSGMTKAAIDNLLKSYGRITLTKNAAGGIYERASGGLREAKIAAGGPTQYAWAEQSTGGEAFIPRLGDRARSLSIWQHVGEKWLGQSPGSGSRSGPVTVLATIPITLGTETISRQVRLEVDTALGEVTSATVYQTA
ncbi:phage tail tape measure protein [Actinoplanes palleronii]|uniref:Phage tail tape measure protein domain-containing protein n=1 Tax=Actinoplanes palleronii TaxID=113570 RepID=A0ABQ4BJ73_9ACTN|nr:phage tail tape measure protein [Actinoplanes palleronii]GIE70726.1 hypothetical protein Apa02nite_068340 [Actinoplanes palleronii]